MQDSDNDGFKRSEEEKAKIKSTTEAAAEGDEKRVRSGFAGQYRRLGERFLNSKFESVRDLVLTPTTASEWSVKAGAAVARVLFLPVNTQSGAIPSLAASMTRSSSSVVFVHWTPLNVETDRQVPRRQCRVAWSHHDRQREEEMK